MKPLHFHRCIMILAALTIIKTEVIAQDQHLIDSLQTALDKHRSNKKAAGKNSAALYDTTEANILNSISKAYWGSNPDKAIKYANLTLELSQKTGYKKGIANAYYSLGNVSMEKGEYLKAIELENKSLDIYKEIENKPGIAACYNTIGIIYWNQGNYSLALKNYFAALKYMEEAGNKYGIAIAYGNIGIIHVEQRNYNEALKNYTAALKIFEQIGDQKSIATCYNNLGNVYADEGKYNDALKFYSDALKIQQDIKEENGIAISYNNIGELYVNQDNYPEAMKSFLAARQIQIKLEDKEGLSNTTLNIGRLYFKQHNYREAYNYLNKSLFLSKEIGSWDNLKSSYIALAQLDSASGNFKEALIHYKLFIDARDSLYNEENTRKIVQVQMQYDFDKRESLAKAAQEKKDAIAQKELQKQKLVRNSFVGGFAIVLLFAAVFFKQRNRIKKGKELSDELLLNILPAEVAEELKDKGSADAKQYDEVSVLFTDFKNFTQLSEKLTPKELVAEINECFSAFDYIMQKHGVEKIKTIGDAYMAAGGLPVSNKTHAEDVVNAALAIQKFMLEHKLKKLTEGKLFFEIRIGVHTGPVVAGIVGVKKFAYDIWGDTVNTASRMESSGEVGKVNISEPTYELVKEKFKCEYRGEVEAKGKGKVKMYFVEEKFYNHHIR